MLLEKPKNNNKKDKTENQQKTCLDFQAEDHEAWGIFWRRSCYGSRITESIAQLRGGGAGVYADLGPLGTGHRAGLPSLRVPVRLEGG